MHFDTSADNTTSTYALFTRLPLSALRGGCRPIGRQEYLELHPRQALLYFTGSGCSAVRLARFVRDEEAGGSSPLTPTNEGDFYSQIGVALCSCQRS